MKEIPLTKGYVALVDDEDFPYLNRWKWTASVNDRHVWAYRITYPHNGEGKITTILMARVIMCACKGTVVDHIDHNALNNQKSNLRLCTQAENMRNMDKTKDENKTSRFKGASWDKRRNCWRAQIQINYHNKHLGRFHDEIEAAKAYNRAAEELFGEYACLNVIPEETEEQ